MVRQSGETGHSREGASDDLSDEDFQKKQNEIVEKKQGIDDDVDNILDEIDDVLEVNAEDFVKSFIQKGGQ